MKLTLILSIALYALCTIAKGEQLTASWYGRECAGKPMANGQPFNPSRLTCASWHYPLGTKLKVQAGGKAIVVLVSDRGPNKRLLKSRQIDLSQAAFARLGDLKHGLMSVSVSPIH